MQEWKKISSNGQNYFCSAPFLLGFSKTYGIKGIGYNGPVYQAIKTEGNKAVLTFNNAPYLTSYKKDLTLFEIAGADKVFYPAEAKVDKNKVTVQSSKVKNPVAVRYAFKE